MFACKVCAERNLRIEDLKAEIDTLRKLIVPPPTHGSSAHQLEADGVLSGRDEPIAVSKSQAAEFERIESEANRLLSGNYDL